MSEPLFEDEAQAHPDSALLSGNDVIAGTVGGWLQVLVGQPMDICKVRLQSTVGKYSGFGDCLTSIVREEGVTALWSGTVMPLAAVGACVAIQFATNEAVKRVFQRRNDPGHKLSLGQHVVAGMAAGTANTLIIAPVEHVRIRLQTQSRTAPTFQGPLDCCRQIVGKHGLTSSGLFRGTVATLIRESIGFGGYFAVYNTVLDYLANRRGCSTSELGTPEILAAGSASAFGFWVPIFPIDTIKSKLQTDNLAKPRYTGLLDCARQTLRADGFAGFMRGFSACLIRGMPANAATFIGFETVKKYLNSKPAATNITS